MIPRTFVALGEDGEPVERLVFGCETEAEAETKAREWCLARSADPDSESRKPLFVHMGCFNSQDRYPFGNGYGWVRK